MGGSNKKKPQRTGSKKESISKILKNSELTQRNINVTAPSNLAAIVKASSLKQSESSSGGTSSGSGNSSHGTTSGSVSSSASGFGIRVTLLCMLYLGRIGFVMLPQHGYVMPDEFFQSTEPLAGDSLNVTSLKTWEFDDNFPLRSMFFPQILFGPVYGLIKYLSNSSSSNITAYALLVGPRLVITLFSLLIDMSVLKICKILYSPGQNSGIFLTAKMLDILLIHASSYLAFTYYCHTFSNTVETALFALLLNWVIDSTTTTVKGRCCPNIRIGAVMALGFFNRPTFALYACAPVITWLLFYTPSSTASQRAKLAAKSSRPGVLVGGLKNILVNSCRLIGPFTFFTVLMVIFDTWYYRGSDKIIELANLEQLTQNPVELAKNILDTVVLTPGNFMIYNLQSKNLANHGLHPFYFHGLVSFPLMFSLLGIMWYLDVVIKAANGKLKLNSCGINVLHASIFVVLLGFSAIPHQEPRFLLGLIVPLVCLLGHQIYGSSAIFTVWMLFNGALTVFYGHIHQAGVTASLFDIRANIVQPAILSDHSPAIHVVFLRQYLPPRHLLAVPNSLSSQIQLHDLSVTDYPQSFQKKLRELDSVRESANIYITGPGCLSVPFQLEVSSIWPGASLQSVHEYFPHFTGEDFDKSLEILKDTEDSAEGVNSLLTRLYRAFSFGVWKVELPGAQNRQSIQDSTKNSGSENQEQQSEFLKQTPETNGNGGEEESVVKQNMENNDNINNEHVMTEQNVEDDEEMFEHDSQSQQP